MRRRRNKKTFAQCSSVFRRVVPLFLRFSQGAIRMQMIRLTLIRRHQGPPTISISHFSQDPDCSKTDIFEVSRYRHSAAVGVKPPLPRERWIPSRFVKCIGRRSEKGTYFPRYPALLRRPLNNPSHCFPRRSLHWPAFHSPRPFLLSQIRRHFQFAPGRESERQRRESPNQSLLLGIGLNLHTTADRGGKRA